MIKLRAILHCGDMRSLLWLALSLHIALATAYAWETPAFEAPDENSHSEYAWHIANAGHLPITQALAQQRGLPQNEGAQLAHHPPLYYGLLAAAMAASGQDDVVFGPRVNPAFGKPGSPSRGLKFLHEAREHALLRWLRLISVALGAVTICFVHRLGRLCCPEAPRVGDLAALLVACLPMWSSLHGSLNSDVLAATLSAATIYALAALLLAERVSTRSGAGLGALLGLALLTKLTAMFLVVLAAAIAAVLWRRARDTGADAKRPIGAAVLTTLALCAWQLVRNWQLYDDPLAMRAHDAAFTPLPAELRWAYFFGAAPWPDGVPSFLPTIFTSLFGRFGWFAVPPHATWPWIGAGVTILAGLGLVRARCNRERSHWPRAVWLLTAAVALVFAGTAWFNLSAPQPQGRLLAPAVAPASVLLAAGLLRATASIPHRTLLALLLPAAAGATFWLTLLPGLDAADAPAPPDHRSLVGGIVRAHDESIAWRGPPPGAPANAPLQLSWSDPGAPAGTRYTLYVFDDAGRVWLATHEWSKGGIVIEGDSLVLDEVAWAFVPSGRPLFCRLRRVPDDPEVAPESLPATPPLAFKRR